MTSAATKPARAAAAQKMSGAGSTIEELDDKKWLRRRKKIYIKQKYRYF